MKGAEENTKKLFNLSLQTSSFSSDLIHEPNSNEVEKALNDDELELTLGLSMNGRFGVDPIKKKLKRSSTISDFPLTIVGDNEGAYKAPEAAVEIHAQLLSRTRSLPTEAEELLRKRKQYQSMRRLEARKKRLEKMKSGSRIVRDKVCTSSEYVDVNKRSLADDRSHYVNGNESVRGLVESKRSGGSSASSDLDQGKLNESAAAKELHNNTTMFDMPHVTTKETGPNGRKTEGFLYRYKRGEEVKIVCVCHGMFLSPAEFVKHGGVGSGGEVEHPLKHIVVNPFPLL